MNIFKRVKALETAVKQSTCEHSRGTIKVDMLPGTHISLRSTCRFCGKITGRIGVGEDKELYAAAELLHASLWGK